MLIVSIGSIWTAIFMNSSLTSRPIEFDVERVLDMDRNLVGRDENEVKTAIDDVAAGDPPAAGIADAPGLPWGDRCHGGIEACPCLDLDKGGDATAPGDDVDLAQRRADA